MRRRSLLLRYGAAVVATVLATLLRKLLDPLLGDVSPFSAYFVAIMFTAWYGGLGPSVLALVSGALLASFLFIEPRGSFAIHDLEHQVSLGLYVFVGVVVALLSESLHANRRRTEAAHARTGGRQPRAAKGNRGTPTGRGMAARKRTAVPRVFRARTGRHGDVVGERRLDRGQPSTGPNPWLFGRGTAGQDLDRIDSSRRLAWRGRAVPAHVGRRHQRLCRGQTLYPQGWTNGLRQPFGAVHEERRWDVGLHSGPGPGHHRPKAVGGRPPARRRTRPTAPKAWPSLPTAPRTIFWPS